jgi:phytoene dehydrogenase-like protein
MSANPIVIIGGGLAGLACARTLHENNVDFLLVEGSNVVGGRIRTDIVNGFQLDRGFQVLQTAYPEAQRVLDYPSLKLHSFAPGAWIRTSGKFVKMADPWRRPTEALSTLFNGVGRFRDRLKLARLRHHVTQSSIQSLWNETDSTTHDYLRQSVGLSDDMIDRFFRPWFSGVFFEKDLATSSRFFRFVFRMFAMGDVAVPEKGMGAIPSQLAERLPPESIMLSSRVRGIDDGVQLTSGERINGRAVVLAVEGPEAARLSRGLVTQPISRSTTCYYFAALRPPFREPLLVLNGERKGPINNLSVISNVAPSYAPPGQSLISASIIGAIADADENVDEEVKNQLRDWYGSEVDRWELLRRYDIEHALPAQPAHFRDGGAVESRVRPALYHCGDYCETTSIHGALLSGRKTAENILSDLKVGNC